MAGERDPVEQAAPGSTDLYGIATWEPRSWLDRLAAGFYRLLTLTSRVVIVAAAFFILVAIGGLSAIADPQTAVLTLLSAIPAFGLAGYVWYTDVTSEPLSLLVGTFFLGVLTATFAAVLNSAFEPYFQGLAFLGSVLFFFLVVGPVEETVKLLAIRLFAYGSDRFDTVLDGAVYGAMAGLGFAFIENALYIQREVPVAELEFGVSLIGVGGGITAVRAVAGPGHVIYSAFAGYYLGLAKFNPEHRGPIVIKGILVAAFIHGLYNSTTDIGTFLIHSGTGLPVLVSFLVYVVIYDGFWGYLLFKKIRAYRKVYQETGGGGAVGSSFEFGSEAKTERR
ncbi:MAG: PrsW family intramembrane metalloprotease [Halolamina sp.]